MLPGLLEARARVASRATSAVELIEESIEAARSHAAGKAFIRTSFEQARAAARAVDGSMAAGVPAPPLGGLSVSVKDLFDVAGEVTAAGSTVFADRAPARTDAIAVARLRRAGAAFIGRTNMTEFAFSGVGINPHHGTPVNPVTKRLDPRDRIPGGSTSGGAVSVATGAAWVALGSDTGGSIRIPAALQGLVGFKSTARLVPADGAVPLSTTLDTVCAITRTVGDAIHVHELLANRIVRRPGRPLHALRFGVPTTVMLDALDEAVAAGFERALDRLRAAGARVEEIDLPLLAEAAGINSTGGFSAAEAWAFHRERLVRDADSYDPRVALRIRRGEAMSAADYIDLVHARRDWIDRMERALDPYDAMLSPTVPCIAPLLAPLIESDAEFFTANALLLRNPSLVNLLDGCAISLPCSAPAEWPVGLMVWSGALQDDIVLEAGLAIEAALGSVRHDG